MEHQTEELLQAARATARETEELVEEGRRQISGIRDKLRLLTWLSDQVRQLMRSALNREGPDAI